MNLRLSSRLSLALLRLLIFVYFLKGEFLGANIQVFASEEEYRLLQDLRENYDAVERPVQNHSEPIDVNLRILLQQIVDVDEKNQLLTTVIWTEVTWFDYKMRWSPEEYAGIRDIQMPPDALWRPDILLFNSADENFDARFPVNFVVQHTGRVLQAPPAIVKSSCRIDITWFPFDEQMCFLKYGSWTYTGRKVRLFIDDTGLKEGIHKMDLSYFIPNGEWELIATPAIREVSFFKNEPYIELYFYLHIKRQPIYYGMNWIIPSILFLLSNVLGFTMPAECGEKITLQTTNLLSVTVFLGMVADITPPTSTSVPIIAAFFSISMVILGSSIIFTLLIINVHFRSPRTHNMSPWVRTVFLEWLPWLLLMNRPGKQFKKPKKQRKGTKKQNSADSSNLSTAQAFRNASAAGGGGHTRRLLMMSQNSQSDASAIFRANAIGRAESVVSATRHNNYLSANDSPLTERRSLLATIDASPDASLGTPTLTTAHATALGAENSTTRPFLQPTLNAPSSVTTSPVQRNQGIVAPRDRRESETTQLLRRTLLELSDYLQISQLKMDEEEEEEEAKADWRFMAMALDRACLFFYALLSAIIPVWMFMSTPAGSLPRGIFAGEGNSTITTFEPIIE